MITAEIKATWKEGFGSLHHADAQKVADEIESIGEAVTPQQIVEKAEDKTTELHKCFTWNDTEAAKKYRLYEARQIVCHLVISHPEENKETPEIRYFYCAEGQGYKPTSYIVRSEDDYSAMLRRALNELSAFSRKYSALAELENVFDEIDKVMGIAKSRITMEPRESRNIRLTDS